MPKISVIIPNYNHAVYLKQRIDSVLNQTFQNLEVIILDDCSIDNSRAIIEEYRNNPRVSNIVYNQNNGGSAFKQWERGIELAKGELIWIAESDDFTVDFFLEKAISTLAKDNSDLFFCQSLKVNESNDIISDYLYWTKELVYFNWDKSFTIDGNTFIKETLSKKNVIINASSVLFKKSNFNFSEIKKYKYCGDWLFWILYLHNKKLSYCPEKLNYFRWHPSTTRNIDSFEKKILKATEDSAVKNKILEMAPSIMDYESLLNSIALSVETTPMLKYRYWKNLNEYYSIPPRFLTFTKFVKKKLLKKMK